MPNDDSVPDGLRTSQKTAASEDNIGNTNTTSPTTEHSLSSKGLGSCTVCGTQTKRFCPRCQEDPTSSAHHITRYCGEKCQKGDWTNHKQYCTKIKTRKQLYRAGHFLQALFLNYREIAFDMNLVKVETTPGSIMIHEKATTLDAVLIPFPTDLFQDDTTKNAVLCFRACDDAMRCMYEVLKMVLKTVVKDMDATVMEIRFEAKPGPLTIEKVLTDGTRFPDEFTHLAWRCNLPNDQAFVIDVTGYQFGFSEPVMLLRDYCRQRILGRLTYMPLGSILASSDLVDEHSGLDASDIAVSLVKQANTLLTQNLNTSIKTYLNTNNITFQTILDSSSAQFEIQQSRIIEHVTPKIRALTRACKAKPVRRRT